MIETLNNLLLGFSVALQPQILMYAFIGCFIGTLVGMRSEEHTSELQSH